MPEGPEIKRLAARLGRVLVDRPLTVLNFTYRGLDEFDSQLRSQRIAKINSRGKALLITFESGLTIYSHNQLYGKWVVVRRGLNPKTNRTQRLVISTDRHSAFLFSASEIEVLNSNELEFHPYLYKLGPDALACGTKWQSVYERLVSARFNKRSLGALLLDQSFVAGIGNYLRSEILFVSRLHPTKKPKDIPEARLKDLAKSILSLTWQAFETAGITNEPSRVFELKKKGIKRSKYRFSVFSRTGLGCYECGSEISRLELNGRRLYLCNSCQQMDTPAR
jgi:endonuclease-8